MKVKSLKWIVFALFAMLIVACEKNAVVNTAQVTVVLHADGIQEVTEIELKAHDINMNKDYSNSALMITVPVGYYDLSVHALGDGQAIRAYKRGIKVEHDCTIEMEASFVSGDAGFVLAEIFFAGTETPEGKRYIGDKYFVLFNNAADTLSADGLILIEADLNSVQKYDLGDHDFRDKYFAVDAMYRIPGDGNTYRVAPGQMILIADNAMNHTAANANSFDLSTADFEWYDVSSSAGATDVDNPDVTNLDKLYCYTQTIWVPHNQGHKSFGLARFPEGVTEEAYFATDSLYVKYDYEVVTSAGTFSQSRKSYMIPNEWIVDMVNMAPSETFQWLTSSDKLDAGYAYVAPTGSDVTRFGKAVRRKTKVTLNGVRTLQDTNNSSDDFEMGVPANPFYFKN
ncbi:MAG: DUF4876 domain-containing protein [Paludibacteraceae bacterium]|nr:DUF4876 domain-containing protein [Paludibacteraceae bacterium]